MRPPSSSVALLVAVAMVGGTAGCRSGGDPGSTDPRDAYVAAAASAFTSGNGGPALASDVAECVGAALVDVVGAPELTSRGVSAQELADAPDLRSLDVPLPDGAEQTLAGDLGDCELAEALVGPVAEQIATDVDLALGEEEARCVTDSVDPGAFEGALAATFVDRARGQAAFEQVLTAVRACTAPAGPD